jgi:hypothetical protein
VCSATVDGLAVDKGVSRCSSHRVWIVRIHVINVVNIRCVEDIDVVDSGVPDIDVIDERPAATEPGIEWLPKSQWEPSDTPAKAEPESEAPTAKEADECWTVDGRSKDRSGAPAPPATEIIPAAVVEWSKAPRFIVNPAPAPRAHPIPITHAVGRPAHSNVTGIPHGTVVGLFAPGAVVIEVGVAGHVARDVLRGDRVVFPTIAFVGPLV